ncbi:hypothetical protein ASG31_13180 [Chryseobacterium sp. Leaf404]|uniref:hypothetical protein n=1 Tax=unclassified Chryseobacterium TaxID=2593645 RepID=UPI0006F53AEF|nr:MULTISPECIES: hypothetical protein [unclassified Chryseobacterium]KQT16461.1 hypothetical protein ASG31_13180 [Chryseobacterium sp. Leaf404]
MQKRQVPFSAFINLLKERRPYSTLGILFPLSAILISVVLSIVLNLNRQPFESYDYEKIEKNGIEKTAVISHIEKTNMNINGESVKIITYKFDDEGKEITDKFKMLKSDKLTDPDVGKEIQIKFFEGQSVIKDIEPFVLPIYYVFIFASVFLLIGIPFFIKSVIPSLKNFNLYKNGIVKDAEIVSMEINSNTVSGNGFRSYRTGNHTITVNYFFKTKNGSNVFGKSITTDFSILNEKKSGDIIKIFVSENNESKSCLIPKLEALKNNWKI